MNINAIREFVNGHPEGVLIRMVDGTEYRIPHCDYIWFTPTDAGSDPAPSRFASSFYVAHEGVGRLVNALLVAEVAPLAPGENGPNGQSTGRPT